MSAERSAPPVRHLIIVLGDQLDLDAAAFDEFDATQDLVWMSEVTGEATHVWSSKPRIAMFLSAMRHFRLALQQAGRPLSYGEMDAPDNCGSLAGELQRALHVHRPQRLVMTAPGDWRVLTSLKAAAATAGIPLDIRDDRHFYATVREFTTFAAGRATVRMEDFYRAMRRRHDVLMDGDAPLGGRWNFDAENRQAFGRAGPGALPPRLRFAPDELTRAVLELVERRFASHPGSLGTFAWPVSRADALQALRDFIVHRLPQFGRFQDALWMNEPWLYHSQLSAALNLKLLSAREVVDAVQAELHAQRVPLASAEGFIRQVLGWREYVRGVYWTRMPHYEQANELQAQEPLPAWYWSGATDMACLRDTLTQTLHEGYAHHIQRLMITGLYALLLGVRPHEVHQWYLAVYVDAVEWVELPNTLGMSQFADGGYMASKPYAASGAYIQRMSNYCSGCRYDPKQRVGDEACPFTTLYWDFLQRHRERLDVNPRMRYPLANLSRMSTAERSAIAERAQQLRTSTMTGTAPLGSSAGIPNAPTT